MPELNQELEEQFAPVYKWMRVLASVRTVPTYGYLLRGMACGRGKRL